MGDPRQPGGRRHAVPPRGVLVRRREHPGQAARVHALPRRRRALPHALRGRRRQRLRGLRPGGFAITAILAGPHIDGAWATPTGGRVVDVINPATEEAIGQAHLPSAGGNDPAVRAARAAPGPGAAAPPGERAAVLARAGELIGERSQEIARTITLEVGSPRAIAEWQPLAARLILEWHAAQAATFPWEQDREG